jgi:poly-gamma-glutamate capsule biosynthesis protein CapA/YwtB (metallophosphatase superfamily)
LPPTIATVLAYVPIDVTHDRAQELFTMIGAAKYKGAVVIISAHWGPNWGYEPPKWRIRFAHRLIDEGAHIIFGHSSHVFRGIASLSRAADYLLRGKFHRRLRDPRILAQ